MESLKLRTEDVAYGKQLVDSAFYKDPKKKYVAVTEITELPETSVFLREVAKPAGKHAAFATLEKIKKLLDEKKRVEYGDRVPETNKIDVEEINNKPNFANFILINGAAQKIQAAVNAKFKLGAISRFFDFVWSWICVKAGKEQTQLQKINKLYAEIVDLCQKGYDATAPVAPAPANNPAPAGAPVTPAKA